MEVLQRTANRGSISTGYDIDNSLKLEPDNSESLTRSAQDGGDRKKVTLSFWCKRTELAGGAYQMLFLAGVNSNKYTSLGWGTGDEINFHYYNSGSYPYNFLTVRKFRDTSAFYHIVVAIDTTQSTDTDRVKFYVNGVEETSLSTNLYPDQNIDTPFNNDSATYPCEIGNDSVFSIGGNPLAGYLADYYLIDGSQLAPTEFGEFDNSGIWKPKAYTGTFGNNGFYLDFADASDLGDDESGNGNDFTEVNIAAADHATDTPTNNFATLNVLNRNSATASNNPTYTEGNTRTTSTLDDYWQTAIATIGVTSGKWYMEGQLIYDPAMAGIGVGDFGDIENWGRNNDHVMAGKAIGYGTPKAEVGDSLPASANDYTNSNIIGVALDADNGKVYWSKDGTYQSSGDPVNGTNGISIPTGGDAEGLYMFAVSAYKATHGSYTGNAGWLVNFGGYTTISISSAATDANGYGTFEYAPPSGYYALCTKNLAEYG